MPRTEEVADIANRDASRDVLRAPVARKVQRAARSSGALFWSPLLEPAFWSLPSGNSGDPDRQGTVPMQLLQYRCSSSSLACLVLAITATATAATRTTAILLAARGGTNPRLHHPARLRLCCAVCAVPHTQPPSPVVSGTAAAAPTPEQLRLALAANAAGHWLVPQFGTRHSAAISC